jgi:hypothetical protein
MQERRGIRRFSFQLPTSVRIPESGWKELNARTRDISARGVYIYLEEPVRENSKLEFVLTLPPEVTLTDSIRVRCTAQVVRADRDGAGKPVGIAAQITQYVFLVDQ